MKTLKYAWRFLVRSKSYTVINIVGLSLSLACTIILVRYIHQETRVNTHCIDAENVYIPLRDIDGNVYAGSVSDGYSGADTVFYSPEAVKEKARFVTFSNDNVAINGKPYTVQLLAADTAFFHFFTYPLSGTPMKAPNDVLVTRQFAERVFGKENPIGEKLSYSGGHLLTVCGVLDEPACKSSLTFDIVLNLELKNGERGWGKMLVELIRFMPGVDVDAINAISNIYRQADGGYRIRYDFIPVSELYWNKILAAKADAPEMWHYSSRFHLWVLSCVCLLLLLAGILNFVNIYLVFMLKRSKEYGIRKVFGMRGRTLFLQLWTENVLMVLIALFFAWFFIEMFSGYANRLLESNVMYIREGMNNDVVKSIVEDKNGNLWFTTEIGLSCFNKATEQFRNYDKYDGFLNVELEEGSALRALNGDLWLGSRQGILTFSPDKLETQHTNYDTRIVDFKVSNRNLRSLNDCPIQESITYTDALQLKYNQSMFTIEFAALNFYNQNRVSYRYILEGYEKEWHYNGKNRIASYTNVPPGDYVFRVETMDEANPELVSTCTLAVTILPPWWLSWWATLIYVILGIAALYFGLRLAFFMIKMKNDIYIEQKVSEMKIKFFTNISHELRTPLTLIKGPIQELKEREELSPKGLQYVDLMEKNTNQMLQLVNQILDFRKIQNGKMRLHVSLIDFNEMIASFQKEFRVLSEENEISFTFQLPDEPIMVWADKDKLSIVIRNVISNAFKFTPSGGSIYVTTGLTDDGKSCYVRVEDNGVGIPQNKLSEIFERFSQGENANNPHYQGTGIGLALSKEIVNLHHGIIRAESPEGQGAVFIVELLLDKDHYCPSEVDFYVSDTETAPAATDKKMVIDSEKEPEEELEIDASLPTLLLVEDNKDLCQLIKLQLEDKFNIHIANNGVEGLKKVHLYHPDIVVTDQMMPEMDGLEMLQSIRKDFQISHIPVIILTAKNDEGAKTKAITLGANAYITKPFSKEYLLARIDQLLGERKLFRERIRQQMENQTTTEEDSYEQYLVKKDVQFLEKIHQVIEENMDDSDFNIDTIASGIGLSRSAFFKKLKSLTGLAPVDLVKEIRLNKSIELIKNTDLSVSEVAFAVGFKDSGYYSKCFRKKYNQTPREYMNEWRKG